MYILSGDTRRLDGMLENKVTNTAHVRCRFRQGAKAPCLPTAPLSVEAIRAYSILKLLLKALYLPGCCRSSRLLSLLLKEPDYSLFRLLLVYRAGYCRVERLYWLCLPAAAH